MSFFKAYDMRGTFGTDFDLGLVYRIGRTLPRVVGMGRWLVGRDGRTTSQDVRDALVSGLTDAGVTVTDLGICTTSMVYFYTATDGYDGSVMITASHNPPSDNGLKVSMRTALPVGYANGLQQVEEYVHTIGPDTAKIRAATAQEYAGMPRYLAWQKEHAGTYTLPKIAVDCSNGMASLFAHEMFPGAVILNDTIDGAFPCHSPNPLKAEAREQLARVVREQHLDAGVIFDGDADRAMFVDNNGDFVQPDYLIPIIVRSTLEKMGGPVQGAKVIHDVRTSRGVQEVLREMGCEPVMVPVGHAFAKPMLRRVGAVCGGELAGHYYFSEFFGCDSGLLAASRVLRALAQAKSEGHSFHDMMRPITTRYANSGEINFSVADKDAVLAQMLEKARRYLPPEIGRETMDGIRIEYAEGWINIRKSNTEPYLRLIVEAKTAEMCRDWVALLQP